jgi:hypothetical protein
MSSRLRGNKAGLLNHPTYVDRRRRRRRRNTPARRSLVGILYAIHLEEGELSCGLDHLKLTLFFCLLPVSSHQICSRALEERTRERLRDFVARIKLALAALSGLGSL